MQAAQNHLNQLDMGAFRREIEDVAKRLGRKAGSARAVSAALAIFFFRCLDVPLLQACRQNGENV